MKCFASVGDIIVNAVRRAYLAKSTSEPFERVE